LAWLVDSAEKRDEVSAVVAIVLFFIRFSGFLSALGFH
jgi:hypothetical protein